MTALTHTEAALSLLTTSGAYARVKRENPNRFEETALRRCARELEAAIADLTPPKVPSLVRTREDPATLEPYYEDNGKAPVLTNGVWTCEVGPQVAGKSHNAISRLHWNETIPVGERFAIGARFWVGKDFRGTALRVENYTNPDTGKYGVRNRLELDRFSDGYWRVVRNRYWAEGNDPSEEYTPISNPFGLPIETWFDLRLETRLGGGPTIISAISAGTKRRIETDEPNWSTGNFTTPPIERVRFGVVEGSQSPPCKVLFASPYVERMT